MSLRVESKFVSFCDSYANSKLILSNQALTQLLRLIASENELFSVLEKCAKDFNFKEEFQNAQINTGTGYIFRLPGSKKALVALVASLLYSFDNGSISVLDFLEKFYPHADGVKDSFPLMTKAIILPFRDAVLGIMRGEQEEEIEVTAEEVEKVERVPDGAVVHGSTILRSLSKLVLEDGSIDREMKGKYLEILDGALHALEIKDAKLIKSHFTALTLILGAHRNAFTKLRDLESCYKLYLVL